MDTPNGYTDAPQKEGVMSAAQDTWNRTESSSIGSPSQGFIAGWNEAIYAAQEELVKQDQFSERTLRILDGLISK